jgi:hypothetical protein
MLMVLAFALDVAAPELQLKHTPKSKHQEHQFTKDKRRHISKATSKMSK